MLSGTTRDWTHLDEQCGVHGLLATLQVTISNGKLCVVIQCLQNMQTVTFVFGYVHVWCCHKFVCLCIKCIVKGQRAGTCIREVTQVFVVSYVPPI